LFNYINGYLRLKISGFTLEKFINLSMRRGIVLWDMKRQDNSMYVKMRISDFRQIRPLVRKTHCKIEILTRHGFPFILYSVRHRKMLIAGGVLFCICLYLLSSFVWFVEVSGLISLPPEAVLHVARQAGLKPGIMKRSVDLKQVEHILLLQIPDIAWAGITLRGTRAIVEIAEKTVVPVGDKAPANILAAKDGLVEELIVLVGEARVRRGETVRQGQTLISGNMVPKVKDLEGNLVPNLNAPVQLVHAQGIAKARIWYQTYGEAGLNKEVTCRTGRTYTRVVSKVGEVEKIIKGGEMPFLNYEIEEASKTLLGNGGIKTSPVELKVVTYYELKRSQVPLTPEEAREEAKLTALAALQEQIPDGVQVLSRNIEVLKTAEPDLIRVKVIVETLEDIGIAQHIHTP
jgi:similar to stage IV sporulation protein